MQRVMLYAMVFVMGIVGVVMGQGAGASQAAAPATTAPAATNAAATPAVEAPSVSAALTNVTTGDFSGLAALYRKGIDLMAEFAPRLLGAIVVMLITWFIAGWVRSAMRRAFKHTDLDETLERFLANIAKWVVMVVGIVAAVQTLGIQATSVIALLGTAGVAVGLALQGSLSHFASGVMLLIFRPFKAGDLIVVAGHEGIVDSIDLFSTALDTVDNRRVIIPNGAVYSNTIVNLTHNPTRVATLKYSVRPDAKLDGARQMLIEAARKIVQSQPGAAKDKEPVAVLVDSTPAAETWAVSIHAKPSELDSVKEAMLLEINEAISKRDFAPPLPPPPLTLVKQVT
jgi:small conductance mechanosensitive channel